MPVLRAAVEVVSQMQVPSHGPLRRSNIRLLLTRANRGVAVSELLRHSARTIQYVGQILQMADSDPPETDQVPRRKKEELH